MSLSSFHCLYIILLLTLLYGLGVMVMEDMFVTGEAEFVKIVIIVVTNFDREDLTGALKAKLNLLSLGVAFSVIVK